MQEAADCCGWTEQHCNTGLLQLQPQASIPAKVVSLNILLFGVYARNRLLVRSSTVVGLLCLKTALDSDRDSADTSHVLAGQPRLP